MTDQQDTLTDDSDDTARIDEQVIQSANAGATSSNPHVEELARAIGSRPPGSEQEGLAADYLIHALRDIGLPAARLQSNAPRNGSLTEQVLTVAALVAILVAVLLPALGLILLVGVLALTVAEIYGYVKIARFIPLLQSVNVLSIVPPADTEVRRLIVTSTLDTGKAGILSRRHMTHYYSLLHVVVVGALVVAALATVIVLVDSGNNLRPLLVVPALAVVAVLALIVERERSSITSPGAISNASGVASMIDIARTTVASPPRWLEVWFLGVGASTLRGGGMRDFLMKNSFDPDTTYFVHLQGTGGGTPTVPKSVGAGLRTAPATPLLTWIFDSVRGEPAGPNDTEVQRLQIESLAHVTHRAGYQSVVLAGVDKDGRIPYLDNGEDLPYQVQEECIDDAARLVALAIDALDREVAARAMLARSTASVQDTGERQVAARGLPTDAG